VLQVEAHYMFSRLDAKKWIESAAWIEAEQRTQTIRPDNVVARKAEQLLL